MTDIEAIKRGGGLSKDQVIAYFGVVPRLLIESGSAEEDISDMIAYISRRWEFEGDAPTMPKGKCAALHTACVKVFGSGKYALAAHMAVVNNLTLWDMIEPHLRNEDIEATAGYLRRMKSSFGSDVNWEKMTDVVVTIHKGKHDWNLVNPEMVEFVSDVYTREGWESMDRLSLIIGVGLGAEAARMAYENDIDLELLTSTNV